MGAEGDVDVLCVVVVVLPTELAYDRGAGPGLANRHRWRSTARGAIAEERMDPLSCPAGSVAAWIQNSRCCWWFCWSASAPPQTPGRTQTSQPSRTATGGVHTSVAIGEPRAGVTGACCTAPARGPYAPCSRPWHRRNVTSPNARARAAGRPLFPAES